MFYIHTRCFPLLLITLIKLKRAFPMHFPTLKSEKCHNFFEGLSRVDAPHLPDTVNVRM